MRITRWARVALGASVLSAVSVAATEAMPANAAVPDAPIIATTTAPSKPLATRDGRYLVTGTNDGSVVATDVATGVTATLIEPGGLTGDPVIAESSPPRLVWGAPTGHVLSRPLIGGAAIDLGANVATAARSGLPIISPDGRYVSWVSVPMSNLGATAVWMSPVDGPAPTSPVASTSNFFAPREFTGDSSAFVFVDTSTGTSLVRAAPVTGGPTRTLASSGFFVTAPAGGRVWYRTGTAEPNLFDAWTVGADGSGTTPIAGGLSGPTAVFSPDGSTVVTLTQNGGGPLIGPASGGVQRQLAPGGSTSSYTAQFTRDSSHVVLREFQPFNYTTFTAFDRSGGPGVFLAGPGTTSLPASVDDSAAIFTSAGSGSTSIVRVVLATGAATRLATLAARSDGEATVAMSGDGTRLWAFASSPGDGDVLMSLDPVSGASTVVAPLHGPPLAGVVSLAGGRTVFSEARPCPRTPCPYDVRLAGPAFPTPTTLPLPPTTPAPSTTPTTPTAPAGTGAGSTSVLQPAPNPTRLLDTRTGTGTAMTELRPGEVLELEVGGRNGVPSSASAVALNVTAVAPTDAGYLSVWPCGTAAPTASNLNFGADQTVPNLVIAKLGAGGRVCFASSSTIGVIADLAGWFEGGSTYRPVDPERILETRRDAGQIGYVGDKPAAEQVVEFQVTGVGATSVPADADAVVLNVTGVGATDDGYLTVWPCGTPMPTASSLNLVRGATRANLVISRVGAGGRVCIFTDRGTDLLADVAGYFPKGSGLTSVSPIRLLDSRPMTMPVAGATVRVDVTGEGVAPDGATAVVVNVTGTGVTAAGFVTVWPCGSPRPDASNLNLEPGVDAPNLVISKVGTNGEICLFTENGAHLLVDLAGWL